jgi:hypothetical protein
MSGRSILAPAAFLALAASAALAGAHETRTLRESIPLSATDGEATLIVDNLYGKIVVVGGAGDRIEMVAEEIIDADDQTALARAQREVALDVRRGDGYVELYVDGPFRERDRRRRWEGWRHERLPYEVRYELELRVPAAVALRLSTVDGDISVRDVRGDFEIEGVNGSVELSGAGGSGRVRSVNGRLLAEFAASPRADVGFETVNGAIEVGLPPDLSADLAFKTLNGKMLTEFDFRPLPAAAPSEEVRDGMRVIRADGWSTVRVAAGGPRMSFETLNGTIRVRRTQ